MGANRMLKPKVTHENTESLLDTDQKIRDDSKNSITKPDKTIDTSLLTAVVSPMLACWPIRE